MRPLRRLSCTRVCTCVRVGVHSFLFFPPNHHCLLKARCLEKSYMRDELPVCVTAPRRSWWVPDWAANRPSQILLVTKKGESFPTIVTLFFLFFCFSQLFERFSRLKYIYSRCGPRQQICTHMGSMSAYVICACAVTPTLDRTLFRRHCRSFLLPLILSISFLEWFMHISTQFAFVTPVLRKTWQGSFSLT